MKLSIEEKRTIIATRLQEATKLEPYVEITLRGAPYKLEFNNYAVRGILRDTNINILEGFDPAQLNDPDVRCKVLLWGLLTNHPDITEDEVDKLQTLRHAMYITAKLSEALRPWFPDMSDLGDEVEGETQEATRDVPPLALKVNGFATGPSRIDSE